MIETIPKQKSPFLGLKVHSFTQNMRPFPYIFVMFLSWPIFSIALCNVSFIYRYTCYYCQFDTSNHQAIVNHCCQNYRDETLKFRSFEFNTNVDKFGKELFQQLYTYCNGLYFVILTGSHFLLKNIQSSRGRDSSTCSERIISSGLLTFFSGSNDYNCNCLQIDNKDIRCIHHSKPVKMRNTRYIYWRFK
jgi:hypothetical protein